MVAYSVVLSLTVVSLNAFVHGPFADTSDQKANPAPQIKQEQSSILADATQDPSEIANYSFLSLDSSSLAIKANAEGIVPLQIGGTTLSLVLSPSSVWLNRSEDELIVGGVSYCRNFAGHVKGDSNSSVRLSFDDDGIAAWIRTSGDEWFVEPASRYIANSAPSSEILYRNADRRSNFGTDFCAARCLTQTTYPNSSRATSTNDSEITNVPAPVSSASALLDTSSSIQGNITSGTSTLSTSTPSLRILRLLAVTDNQFRAFGSREFIRIINDAVNTANGWYAQVGVMIQVVNRYDWSYDDSSEIDIEHYLSVLQNQVNNNLTYTGFDECDLFAGRNFSGGNFGTSIIRTAGTGFFNGTDTARTAYGFSVTGESQGQTYPAWSELLAHELGHTLNGNHDQADPYYNQGHQPAQSTLMGYATQSYYHWFSGGNVSLFHNNAQRIQAWASLNLHTVLYLQAGGDYGSAPGDSIVMTNYQVIVRDLPGPTDIILNVKFMLHYTGSSNGVNLNYVYTSMYTPSNGFADWGFIYNVHIAKNGYYLYDSAAGTSCSPLADYGKWRLYPCYYFSPWNSYTADTVYVNRYYLLAQTGTVAVGIYDNAYTMMLGQYSPEPGKALLLWNFKVLSFKQQPKVGDWVDVYWGAFNTNWTNFIPASGFYPYVGCQDPSGNWDDFGYSYQTYWVHRSYSGVPGGFDDLNWVYPNPNGNPAGGFSEFEVSSTLFDIAGTYRIIPELYVNGAYYGWYAAEFDLSVSS